MAVRSSRLVSVIRVLLLLRVVVVRGKGVGKSALAVSFLTKRFIGEYQESKGTDNDKN